MRHSSIFSPTLLLALVSGVTSIGDCRTSGSEAPFQPEIPRAWHEEALATWTLPLAYARATPKAVSPQYYYGMTVRPIFKSYPIYAPGHEPPGYWAQLMNTEPQVIWDTSTLRTRTDWERAGELIFDAPIDYDQTVLGFVTPAEVRNPDWYQRVGVRVDKNGRMPYASYVIREKGRVEVGNLSCAFCHTRTLPDGSILKGAQGDFPFNRAIAYLNQQDAARMPDTTPLTEGIRVSWRVLFGAPWINTNSDPLIPSDRMSLEELIAADRSIPPGVLARHGTSHGAPVQIPDLIGIKERRYLDKTGLQLNRDIGDLMRYAAANQSGDLLASYGGFVPLASIGSPLPTNSAALPLGRYSDEQLYALALYLYTLKPPENPNLSMTGEKRELVHRGETVFKEEGCVRCHDPKLAYTNNKLIAAPGYEPPADHPAKDDIMRTAAGSPRRVGTDPGLTLNTRRGTGFYKVPSLLGVWHRGPFEHNGSCATLEDWFDRRRLRDDYVLTGWKGPPGTRTRAVKGHGFGLDLSSADKTALIAFLRTL